MTTMLDSLIGLAVIVALFVILSRQRKRLDRVERELAALRGLVLSGVPATGAVTASAKTKEAELASAQPDAEPGALPVVADAAVDEQAGAPVPGPWAAKAPAMVTAVSTETTPAAAQSEAEPEEPAASTAPPPKKTRDIETALGTRWAVWVGGLALALGGLFLVRYTIEAGVFGPEVRLAMAAVLGLVLVGGGEFIRRTGFKMPVEGAASAYIPAILTAAGAFVLFGTIYAAHAVYGFIGPTAAFLLLGAVAIGTIALALVHGQALAGIGLLGALATPLLIDTQSRNDWALFGYLAIVLAAAGFVARIRSWTFLMTAAFVGIGLWTLLYVGQAPDPDYRIVAFAGLVTLAVLAFAWLGRAQTRQGGFDLPSIGPGLFIGLSVLALFYAPTLAGEPAMWTGAILVAAMLAVALYRQPALALVHAAGATTVLVFLGIVPFVAFYPDLGGDFFVPGQGVDPLFDGAVIDGGTMLRLGVVLCTLFLAAGLWSARRLAAAVPVWA
ncbi:MAG: DUF2339 domain-containing protein, partial [Mesorhizobium sp.]